MDQLNEKEVFTKVESVIKLNKQTNLFHKAFLSPMEIYLKRKQARGNQEVDLDALAVGLKQVIKSDVAQNSYELANFESMEDLDPKNRNIKYLVEHNYDNMISLVKPGLSTQPLQLAICICMYSQNKQMLRKTLAGVANNIATFAKHGISSDKIAVCVVMDGIEKVDSSTQVFFQEMDKDMNVYLDDEVKQMNTRQIAVHRLEQAQDEEAYNLNNFLFDDVELINRKKRRFVQRKRQYLEVRRMFKKIEELERKQNITFYDLDVFLRPFFFDQARRMKKKQQNINESQAAKISEKQLQDQFGINSRVSKPLIQKCLSEAKIYCQKYISTRDDLALISSYRANISFGSFADGNKNTNQYQQLNQEEENEKSINMNLFMITKYKNSGKLSSHNWFFNGFCKEIRFKYSVLLDVGLTPSKNSLYKMYNFMLHDPKCGGVCGYMNLRMEGLDMEEEQSEKDVGCLTRLFLKCADIQRAQQVQYHFGHLLDKPFESIFNFIHVLPGAFSAYRMDALQLSLKQSSSSTLMKQYFRALDDSANDVRRKSVKIGPCQAVLRVLLPDLLFHTCHQVEDNTDQQLLYDSNVYLAEDRTLCMGIHKNGYKLEFLPDAHGWVDPIKTLPGLLGQRKRWINGSFFAFEKVRREMTFSGGDCMLMLQFGYLAFMNMLAFVAPAFFLFTIHIAMFAFRDWTFTALQQSTGDTLNDFSSTEFYSAFVYVVDFTYIMMMLALVLFSMHFTHRNPRFKTYIYTFSTFFGVMAFIVFIVLIYDMIAGLISNNTFLVDNPVLRDSFMEKLPGGETVFLVYKYTVVGVLGIYVVPILVYALFYRRLSFAFEVLCGAFSFLYYSPTYLNILNTFAICRIDDISWGTKGLDSSVSGRASQLIQTWKTIKIIYVAKYVFWNIVVGAAMLVISSPIVIGDIDFDAYQEQLATSYVRKFFLTFIIMMLIFVTLLFKVVLGFVYLVKYKCMRKSSRRPKNWKRNQIQYQSKINEYFAAVKGSLYDEVMENIRCLIDEVKQKGNANRYSYQGPKSIIMQHISINKGKPKKQAIEKWNKSFVMKSALIKKQKKNANIQPKMEKTKEYNNPQQQKKNKNKTKNDGWDSPINTNNHGDTSDNLHRDQLKDQRVNKNKESKGNVLSNIFKKKEKNQKRQKK